MGFMKFLKQKKNLQEASAQTAVPPNSANDPAIPPLPSELEGMDMPPLPSETGQGPELPPLPPLPQEGAQQAPPMAEEAAPVEAPSLPTAAMPSKPVVEAPAEPMAPQHMDDLEEPPAPLREGEAVAPSEPEEVEEVPDEVPSLDLGGIPEEPYIKGVTEGYGEEPEQLKEEMQVEQVEEDTVQLGAALFVKVSDFKNCLNNIADIKDLTNEGETIFVKLNEMKNLKDQSFDKLQKVLEDTERKLIFTDKTLYE